MGKFALMGLLSCFSIELLAAEPIYHVGLNSVNAAALYSGAVEIPQLELTLDITTDQRDAVFQLAKLEPELSPARVDEFGRDQLFYYLGKESLSQLVQRFPSFPRSKLSKAKELVLGRK
ncbi:MAG: hypothetical protein EOP06_01815 [Proteobacteria bacterium]|nr:MAG: hypothetical protein EOP06_01815 [Pseudomonadota bacterium]